MDIYFSHKILDLIGYAILYSIFQGFILLIFSKLIKLFIPRRSAKTRYFISISTLTIIFILFITNIVYNWELGQKHMLNIPLYYDLELGANQNSHERLNLSKIIFQALPYISTLYFLALIYLLIKLIVELLKINNLRSRSFTVPNHFQILSLELSKKLKIKKNVLLRISNKVSCPSVIGHFKPIILFPIAIITHLSFEEIETILLHELAHIKRNDFIWNTIQNVLINFLCFNPAVWIIRSEINQERECACDDLVLQHIDNRKTYAEALLSVAVLEQNKLQNILAINGSNQFQLLNRIKRIMMKKHNQKSKQKTIISLLSILTVLSISVFTTFAQFTKEEKDPHLSTFPKEVPIEFNELFPQQETLDSANQSQNPNEQFNPKNILIDATDTSHKSEKQITLKGQNHINSRENSIIMDKDLEGRRNEANAKLKNIRKEREEARKEITIKKKELLSAKDSVRKIHLSIHDSLRNLHIAHSDFIKAKRQEMSLIREKTRKEASIRKQKMQEEMSIKRELHLQKRDSLMKNRLSTLDSLKKIRTAYLDSIRTTRKTKFKNIKEFLIGEGIIEDNEKKYTLRFIDGNLYINNKRQAKDISDRAYNHFGFSNGTILIRR